MALRQAIKCSIPVRHAHADLLKILTVFLCAAEAALNMRKCLANPINFEELLSLALQLQYEPSFAAFILNLIWPC